jgi:hypothetical protein
MTVAYRPKPKHNNWTVRPDGKGGLHTVCTKRAYDTERAAKESLKLTGYLGMVDYYCCRHCNKYHLSSQRNRSRMNRVKRVPQDEFMIVLAIRNELIRLGIREPLPYVADN